MFWFFSQEKPRNWLFFNWKFHNARKCGGRWVDKCLSYPHNTELRLTERCYLLTGEARSGSQEVGPRQTEPASTLILNSQPPEWGKKALFTSPQLHGMGGLRQQDFIKMQACGCYPFETGLREYDSMTLFISINPCSLIYHPSTTSPSSPFPIITT